MSPFARQFEEHVWPALLRQAKVDGTLVSCGLLSWSDAMDGLARLALSRGAAALPSWIAFEERLARTLLAEAVQADRIARACAALLCSRPSTFWRRIWRTP